MAAVAFSIGSFGDITSLLQIAWAVRALLVEAGLAVVEIKQLVDDVDTFSQSLQQIKAVIESRGDEIKIEIRNAIAHSVSICDGILRAVEAQLSSYKRGLMRKHGTYWGKYWTMVAWSALGGRKAADSLKQRLSEQVQVIHTYLALSHSNDQGRLLNLATEQGTVLTRLYEVVEDVSKRFDFGVPSFKFHDPFDGNYYAPMGRTSLQKLLQLYEWFTCERTCIEDFPDCETHRTMLIPTGFRYHPSYGEPIYALLDCVIFRDAAFGQPQVLLSVPWLVSRERNLDSAQTPFYERISTGSCPPCTCAGSNTRTHMHFRACEQVVRRQHTRFDGFWDDRRHNTLIELSCYYGQWHPEKPENLIKGLVEPDEDLRSFIKDSCWDFFHRPSITASCNMCFNISPIVKLRQKTDCELLPEWLEDKSTALLPKDFLLKIDKYSALFDAEKGSDLVWMCWAEELRRSILNIP